MGKYILFRCQEQEFAVAIEQIEKVLLYENPTRIPDTNPVLLGLIQHEGKQVPVLDTTARLFQEKLVSNDNTKIILVRWKGKKLGLAVENVTIVREFSIAAKEKEANQLASTRYIKEIFNLDDNIVIHLDMDELVPEESEKEILAILEK